MKFFTILATCLATVSTIALPEIEQRTRHKGLKQYQAEDIVNKFISVLQHYDVPAANATVQALLDESFVEISDSILSLLGAPLGTVTFASKAQYIGSVLNAPSVEGIETQEILVAGKSKIIWYWIFRGIGSREYEIKGFNLFTITDELQISAINLEFNNIAWALNTGYQVIFPPGFAPPGGK